MISLKAKTIEVPCPACGSSRRTPFHVERGWRYVRCLRCRTVYMSPRPTAEGILRHYEDYLPDTPGEIAHWDRSQRPLVLRGASLLVRHVEAGGRILDVGCGYGFLAAELANRGFRTEGVEISPTGLRHARSLGIEVREGTLADSTHSPGTFDAVTAFYVIEHLDDPAQFIRDAARILRPGGVLLLRWPHTAPLVRWCRLLGLRYDLYDAPSHLTDFTPRSLADLLVREGFRNVKSWPGGSSRPGGWIPTLAGMLGGLVGDALYTLTGGRALLPGTSKTTLAFREGHGVVDSQDTTPESTPK